MKKTLITERFQELAGIKPLHGNKLESVNNLKEDKFTSPELQKVADELHTAVVALRKASVAKEFYKGNDDWSAFEKAYSVLIQDLKSKEVRS